MSTAKSNCDAKLSKAEQSAQTRALFIRIARHLFAERGYAATSTEQILAETGVTRGALYHQFTDKADLFRAVCAEIHAEIAQEIATAAGRPTDSWQALLAGCDAFLDAAARREVQQILILDGPSVLGWETWNELDRAHGFGLLVEGVRQVIADGFLPSQPAEALAIQLNGAMNEGVAWAIRAPDPARSLADTRAVLRRLLEGLRRLGAG